MSNRGWLITKGGLYLRSAYIDGEWYLAYRDIDTLLDGNMQAKIRVAGRKVAIERFGFRDVDASITRELWPEHGASIRLCVQVGRLLDCAEIFKLCDGVSEDRAIDSINKHAQLARFISTGSRPTPYFEGFRSRRTTDSFKSVLAKTIEPETDKETRPVSTSKGQFPLFEVSTENIKKEMPFDEAVSAKANADRLWASSQRAYARAKQLIKKLDPSMRSAVYKEARALNASNTHRA
jgi:hypothetical protein